MKGLKKRLKKVIVTALIAGLTVNSVPVTAYGARVVSEPGPSCGVQVTPCTVSEDAAAKAGGEASAGSTEEIREISDNTLPTGSGSYKLTKDVTISETWVVSANITLDLSGNTIKMTGNGDVIKVQSGSALTITDSSGGSGGITHGGSCTGRGVYVDKDGSFTLNGGSISGNSVSGNEASGGGVFVDGGGSFEMTGGSIFENTANVYEAGLASKGGGVFVDEGGSFEMTGGSIYGNTAKGYGDHNSAEGAGVYIYGDIETENQGGSFIMNGGSISYNITDKQSDYVDVDLNGAGVFVGNGCSFRMTGGSIYKNRIQSGDFNKGDGGGVFVGDGGNFEMTGGSISGNEAAQFQDKGGDGGGVFVGDGGSFRMTGGSIYENKTGDGGGNGGGVCVNGKSNFTMSGNAVIRNNYANKGNGGGVYFDGSSFRMTGGSIYENKTGDGGGNGGGVYVKDGSFDMSAGSIYGNIAKYNYKGESGDGGGVYVDGGSFTLTGGSISGNNSYCDGGGVYVKDYVINTNNKYDGIFTMTGGSIYENKTGDEGGNGGGVYVKDGSFDMSAGSISGNTSAVGGGVYVDEQGSFTLTGGSISGNKAGYLTMECPGGGVYVGGGGSFTMSGDAVIRENTAVKGGGVYVYNLGRFTMTGGSIIGNEAAFEAGLSVGGGVCIGEVQFGRPGIFIMTGGSISGNTATKGGGVNVYPGNSFTMSGNGVIKDNTAGEYGGGVAVEDVASFTLSGTAEISGNTLSANNTANNVWLFKGKFITVNGELNGTGKVGITLGDAVEPGLYTVARGEGYTLSEADRDHFFSDAPSLNMHLDTNKNELQLCSHTRTQIRGTIPGTCSANGYSGDLFCLDCGAMLEKGEDTPKDPDNHYFDYKNGKVKIPATMFQMGVTTYECCWCHNATVDRTDIPCQEDNKNRDLDELKEDVADLSGNAAPKKDEKKDENGNVVEETVTIGEKEVSKIITDPESGKETMETKLWVGGLKASYTYTGSKIEPEIHVYDGLTCLKKGTDYSLSFKNNKDAGTAGITVKFKGNYKGNEDQTLSFKIDPAVLGKDILAHDAGIYYTKKTQNPVPVLTWAATGKTAAGKDFRVDYDRTVKEPGTYKAVITSKNSNYTGEATALITVTDDNNKLLSKAKVQFDKKSYTYTGESIVPAATLKLGGAEVPADAYVMTCRNNVLPGTATATFEAVSGNVGGFVGTKTATFKISGKRELKEAGPDSDFTYDHSRKVPYAKGGAKPMVTVMDGNAKLSPGTDYTLSYQKNKAVTNGEESACVTVKGKGKYKGAVKLYFAIEPQSLNVLSANITAADQFTTKKKLKKPSITITDPDGKKLKENTDYTVDPLRDEQGSEDAGSVTVKVTGKGAYKDTVPVTFRYFATASSNLAKAKQEKKIADQPFTGNPVALSANDLSGILQSGGKALVYGADFKVVDYINNTKKGTAKVKLHGINSLAGTKTLTFKITGKKAGYQGALIGGEWK